MKISVKVDMEDGQGFDFHIEANPQAVDLVRYKFNPSASHDVDQIKTLTVALMSKMFNNFNNSQAHGFEFKAAVEKIQTASMWCVLTVTKDVSNYPIIENLEAKPDGQKN
jgi:hypothetical protein